MTDNSIPVVVAPETEEKAYRMGYERFNAADYAQEPEPYWFDNYTQSAEWANIKLPKLRAMAGAADPMGHGTYTEHRDIVVVDYPDDRPMSGEEWNSQGFHSVLVDKYRDGAHDKIHGEEYGEGFVV